MNTALDAEYASEERDGVKRDGTKNNKDRNKRNELTERKSDNAVDEATRKAIEHRNRLINYDKTAVARSRVFDG